jgi:hypothetical protein
VTIAGLLAGPLFVVAFLVEGATRADYNPLRHPVSSLALGDYGWTQTANFLVAGALTVAFSIALWRRLGSKAGAILVALWGIGLLGAGAFVTDPVNGYPPGTPNLIAEPTTSGALHDLFSVPGFLSLAAAGVVFAVRFARRGQPGWAAYSALSAVVLATGFFLSGAAFGGTENLLDFGGLFQRIAVVAGFAWLTALAIHVRKKREAQ